MHPAQSLAQFLNQGQFCPQKTFGDARRHFRLSQLVLGGGCYWSQVRRYQVLLNTLEHTGQSSTRKGFLSKMSVVMEVEKLT